MVRAILSVHSELAVLCRWLLPANSDHRDTACLTCTAPCHIVTLKQQRLLTKIHRLTDVALVLSMEINSLNTEGQYLLCVRPRLDAVEPFLISSSRGVENRMMIFLVRRSPFKRNTRAIRRTPFAGEHPHSWRSTTCVAFRPPPPLLSWLLFVR